MSGWLEKIWLVVWCLIYPMNLLLFIARLFALVSRTTKQHIQKVFTGSNLFILQHLSFWGFMSSRACLCEFQLIMHFIKLINYIVLSKIILSFTALMLSIIYIKPLTTDFHNVSINFYLETILQINLTTKPLWTVHHYVHCTLRNLMICLDLSYSYKL